MALAQFNVPTPYFPIEKLLSQYIKYDIHPSAFIAYLTGLAAFII